MKHPLSHTLTFTPAFLQMHTGGMTKVSLPESLYAAASTSSRLH